MSQKLTKVLVTGATGYLASHVVQQCLQKGYNVVGSVRSLKNLEKISHLKNMAETTGRLTLVEADLLKTESWEGAMAGCSHVIHTASPFPMEQPKNADDLIKPAVQGTLSVLEACRQAKSIQRVVLTSSIASIGMRRSPRPFTENDFLEDGETAPVEREPYPLSKFRAEMAAHKFMKNLPDDEKFELSVINPGFLMGPPLNKQSGTSLDFVKRTVAGGDPMIPNVSFAFVDVRDVAQAHVSALTLPEAAGQRFILTDKTYTYQEICKLLKEEFGAQGYWIPTVVAPYFVLKLMSFIDGTARSMCLMWDLKPQYDNTKMKTILGIEPRDSKAAIINTVYELIENGTIEKKAGYNGPAFVVE